ncbi:MAG: trypsin-like peptidase domain-containing protein [Halobacteriales archaeon]|nr:trypsin-like peptidase domain-containing protein [Halobacteriales archaeon]
MSRKPLVIIAVLLVGLVAGTAVQGFVSPTESNAPDGPTLENVEYTEGDAYANLYQEIIDSVVSIRVSASSGQTAQGSGFVYDFNGHIITNQHVVTDADEVEVRFSEGDWRRGEVIGTDVYTDLAVVEVSDVPGYAEPLPLADDHPRQGTPVAALGNPFGLEGSITSGIVSGVNRSTRTESDFSIPDTVQTDAGIDSGNSGGPLVTLDGEVVGVNRARQGNSIGFAVSSALVERVVPDLIHTGSTEHAYMGVSTIDVSPRVADANELDVPRGVLVVATPEGGPSDGVFVGSQEVTYEGFPMQVGGDVIVGVDGKTINSHEELSRYLMLHTEPGQTVDVSIIRDGDRETVQVTLGTRPEP